MTSVALQRIEEILSFSAERKENHYDYKGYCERIYAHMYDSEDVSDFNFIALFNVVKEWNNDRNMLSLLKEGICIQRAIKLKLIKED